MELFKVVFKPTAGLAQEILDSRCARINQRNIHTGRLASGGMQQILDLAYFPPINLSTRLIVDDRDGPEFKVEGTYIPGDERDRILGSEIISLQDARVIPSSNHSFSVSDSLQFVNTKFPKSEAKNLNDALQSIY